MEDPAEQLIRRAVGRCPPPKLGPTLVDDVLRRVVVPRRPAVSGGAAGAGRWLAAATWLATGAACIAVLARMEWSSASRAVAWGLALAMVPLTYSATLWPGRLLGLLALCGGPVLGEPRDEPRSGASPGDRRGR